MATTQIDGNTFTMKLIAVCARSTGTIGRFGTQIIVLIRAATQSAGLNGTFTKTTGAVGDAGTTRAQQLGHVDAVIQSWLAIKTVAPCADGTGARGRFGYESKALPFPSSQKPCSPSPCQYRLRCGRLGFSRRALRHQYRCGAGRTQMTSPLAKSPRLRAWCEWQDRDIFLEQRVYPRLQLQRVTP